MANAARPQNVCPIPLAIVAPIPVAYNIEQFIIASVIIFFLVLPPMLSPAKSASLLRTEVGRFWHKKERGVLIMKCAIILLRLLLRKIVR